jgi:OmpA-OmpF porin, OOP family
MKFKISIILFPFMLLVSCAFAQRISAGTFTGISNYQGDVVKYHLITRESNFAYGGFVRYNITQSISLRANVYHGILSGSDANFEDRKGRGFSFRTTILEGGINVEYDLFSRGRYNKKNQYVPLRTPYIFTGIGAVAYNAKAEGLPFDAKELVLRKNVGQVFNFMIPLGMGYKFDLDEHFTMGVELASHIPFTDYLDGVSESAKTNNNDWYIFGGVTFAYWFNVKKKRPEFIGVKVN